MYGKQMEMFEDGGLNQEGGMVDEVSGNDVPVGSTRSEVRDDIPAMLSKGEFVFPADVVRYFGLERLMEMRQQAKMGLKKMESMGQMGNSEEATMPDDLPFSVDELQYEEDDTEEYAQGGYIKAQQGTFVPAADNMLSSPSYFASNPVNIAPATTLGASGFTEPAPVATQTPAAATQTPAAATQAQTVNVQPQTGSVVQPEFRVPTYQDVYTFKKYINTSTKEIRDFPFYFDQPVTPIPEGFVPYTATAQQQPADTDTQTTQMLQDDGGDDDEPLPPSAPIDYSKMNAEEIMQAYKNNQTASAIMLGVAAAFPPVGLFGAWATNREKNKITARMEELGLEVPKDENILSNVINGVKNLFAGDKKDDAAEAAGGTGAGTGAGAGTTRRADAGAGAGTTRRADAGAGAGAAREVRPAGGLSRNIYETKKAPAPDTKKGRDSNDVFAAAETAAQSARKALETSRGATQKVLDAAVSRGVKAGKSDNEIIKEGSKILDEAKKVEDELKDQAKGIKRGYNKGGLAARTK
jgi:urease gamma subunit